MASEAFIVFLTMAVVVFGQSKDKGFTNEERQYILDLHNYLRMKVATGKESNQPPADYMMAMEWDDRLEERAQKWADGCPTYHSQDGSWYRKVKPYETGENRVEGMLYANFEKAIAEGWYGEYKGYHYKSNYCSMSMCGHYTQVTWQNTTLLGCGWNRCKGRSPVMFCHYGPTGNIYPSYGNSPRRPYLVAAKGAQCKKCPMGFELCMNNGLCAAPSACANSASKCTCPITSCKNGGKLDKKKCQCKCKPAWEGTHCERPCMDTFGWCSMASNKAGCVWDSIKHEWATTVCRKTCSVCGLTLDRDDGKSNKNGIKSNAPITKPKNPKKTGGGGKPGAAKCPNKAGDDECEGWAAEGQCKENPRYMKKNCARSCNSCPVCKNINGDDDCDPWAASGECQKNVKWMKKNCAKSCNACA
ncbi:cysteine-rich venom protein latisemin-like isoform X2 [Lineus longissimus]|uniref:cysteine-rich venom protein latisemin-like isoform X2 n=1 Tax=Lineus longissimus TaxID=88925 RepID=UPI002B4C9E2E